MHNDGETRFGPRFIEQIGDSAKQKADSSEESMIEKAKSMISDILSDLGDVSIPGLADIKNTLIALVPS